MLESKKIFVKTYGCQMNVYDSIKIQDLMAPYGYETTENMDEGDMVILNTCHIREKAAEKVYSELGRIRQLKDDRKKENKKTIIVIAGCVGQAEGDEIFARAPYVDIVVGPQSYHNLPALVSKLEEGKKHLIELDFIEEEKFDNLPEEISSQGITALVSVQEGCDKFCTFCVVPYTRGAEFSRSLEQIYREVSSAVAQGSREVILLGQNVNAYHGKSPEGKEFGLAALIENIAEIKGLNRIRYTTSHPRDMDDALIEAHGNNRKLMPFLHLPVQSGSDKILKAMNRRHTNKEYLEIIDRLKAARPDMAFSSDFIVGFPGETEEDFSDTIDLVRKVKYAQSYSFAYSPRPGTPAASKEQLPEQLKKERLHILQAEIAKYQLEFNLSFIGKTVPVLFNRDGKHKDQIVGNSPYMQPIYIDKAPDDLLGQIVNILIKEASVSSMMGEITK